MKAEDVMTRKVVCIKPHASLLEAAQVMIDNQISGIPVVDPEEKMIGIITESDFLRSSQKRDARSRWFQVILDPLLSDNYAKSHRRKVEEVMSTDLATVTEDTPIENVVNLMNQRHVKRVPVVRDGRLVGIIARADLIRALTVLARQTSLSAGESNIMRERMAQLERRLWLRNCSR